MSVCWGFSQVRPCHARPVGATVAAGPASRQQPRGGFHEATHFVPPRLARGWRKPAVLECADGMNSRILTIAAGALLLIWPAFANGYPLLFSDSAAFMAQLLRPVMLWDKPWVYGPALVASSLTLTLWLPAVVQGWLLSWVLWRVWGVFGAPSPARHLGLCGLLALVSAAPWFAPLLMPDILAPVTVLTLFVLAFQPDNERRWPSILTATFAIAAHLAHLPVAAACAALVLLLRPRRFAIAITPLALACAVLLTSNVIGHGRFSLSPYGSVFVLSRLTTDGPGRDFLTEVCPDPNFRLCEWVGRFPADSDDFMWDPHGPVWTYPGGPIGLAPEATRIVVATLRSRPLAVARSAAGNMFQQLIMTRLDRTFADFGYDRRIGDQLRAHYPGWELARFMASAQRRDGLRAIAAPWQGLHAGFVAAGSVLSLALLVWSWRRDRLLFGFILLIAAGMLANAFVTGALSGPTDRYQARMAWLVLLPPFLWAARVRGR